MEVHHLKTNPISQSVALKAESFRTSSCCTFLLCAAWRGVSRVIWRAFLTWNHKNYPYFGWLTPPFLGGQAEKEGIFGFQMSKNAWNTWNVAESLQAKMTVHSLCAKFLNGRQLGLHRKSCWIGYLGTEKATERWCARPPKNIQNSEKWLGTHGNQIRTMSHEKPRPSSPSQACHVRSSACESHHLIQRIATQTKMKKKVNKPQLNSRVEFYQYHFLICFASFWKLLQSLKSNP